MSEPSLSARTDSTLYAYLKRSHELMRDRAGSLFTAMQANARSEVATLWNELERKLLDHMDAEERFVLPALAHVDYGEASELLREHGLIRQQLLELGVAVDLHFIRYENSQQFLDVLLQHAEREERLLYRWAEERLAPEDVQAIKDRTAA